MISGVFLIIKKVMTEYL